MDYKMHAYGIYMGFIVLWKQYCESLCAWWEHEYQRREERGDTTTIFFSSSFLHAFPLETDILIWWLNTGIWVNRTIPKTNSQQKPVPCSVIFEHQHLSTTNCPLRICFVSVSNQISAHKQVTLLSVSSVNRQHMLDFWVTLVIATPQPLTTKQNRSSLHTCHSQLCHPGQGQACS